MFAVSIYCLWNMSLQIGEKDKQQIKLNLLDRQRLERWQLHLVSCGNEKSVARWLLEFLPLAIKRDSVSKGWHECHEPHLFLTGSFLFSFFLFKRFYDDMKQDFSQSNRRPTKPIPLLSMPSWCWLIKDLIWKLYSVQCHFHYRASTFKHC